MSEKTSTLFGLPRLLERTGMATNQTDATAKARVTLIVITIILLLLAAWISFGSGGETERAAPYYNYVDESDAR